MKTIVVVGGGAAGMMASYQAAIHGGKVFLFEKNSKLGKKILITGKGRCNLTNIKEIEDFIQQYAENGRFLYSSLTSFTNIDLINFFKNHGVRTKVERGGRVFPASDKSIDVVNALKNAISKVGVRIIYNAPVKQLIVKNNTIKGVLFGENYKSFNCDRVIIATGGLFYPETGSTGDGYVLARQVGHEIKNPKPSLVPLIASEKWVRELQGLSLKNVQATVYVKQKKIASQFGEMIFTHYGVSGPIILTLSRFVVDYLNHNPKISVNLKPALTDEELENRLIKEFDIHSKKIIKNSLKNLLPKKLIPIFIKYTGIDPEKPVNQITREERKKVKKCLQNFCITISGCREKEAIITRGGVSIKEIDPKTMESKLVKGLFFAGEVIDVDGLTGGYNLQAAFSTGFVAGCNSTNI